MSKAIVLELAPGGHQIIRDLHNCTCSQLEPVFSRKGRNAASLLHWQHSMEFTSIYLTLSVSFNLLSLRRLVKKKKSPNVNSGQIISDF